MTDGRGRDAFYFRAESKEGGVTKYCKSVSETSVGVVASEGKDVKSKRSGRLMFPIIDLASRFGTKQLTDASSGKIFLVQESGIE